MFFHVTRRENWANIERYGLMRDPQSWNRRNRGEGRDYVHFMYSNPQTSLYIPLGPGTVVPRDYGQPLYVKLNVILGFGLDVLCTSATMEWCLHIVM